MSETGELPKPQFLYGVRFVQTDGNFGYMPPSLKTKIENGQELKLAKVQKEALLCNLGWVVGKIVGKNDKEGEVEMEFLGVADKRDNEPTTVKTSPKYAIFQGLKSFD